MCLSARISVAVCQRPFSRRALLSIHQQIFFTASLSYSMGTLPLPPLLCSLTVQGVEIYFAPYDTVLFLVSWGFNWNYCRWKLYIRGIGISDHFCSCDLDLDPMTFIYEPDPYSLKIYRMCENELLMSRLSKVIIWQIYINIQTQLTEQGLTSHQTHYRSYRGRFLQVIWPKQQCQSTEGN